MRKLLILLALTAAGGMAQAADNGFYIGGGVSQAEIDTFDSDEFGVGDLNDFEIDDTAFKLIAGFRPLEFMAVEANYMDLGEGRIGIGPARFQTEAKAIAAYALFSLPIPVVDVYGKLGLARWELDGSFDGVALEDLDDEGTEFAYGAGVQMNFGSLGARLEWESFDIDRTDGLELLSLGVTWTFL
jgi:opacity protein-like surface antigen